LESRTVAAEKVAPVAAVVGVGLSDLGPLARFALFKAKDAAVWVQAAHDKSKDETGIRVSGTSFFSQLQPTNQKQNAASKYAALQPQCKAKAAQQLQMVLGEEGVSRWADATIRGYAVDRYADGEALRCIAAVVDARSPPLTDKKNRTLLDKLEELELEVKKAQARTQEVDYDARALVR
jgi:hypothetical protein